MRIEGKRSTVVGTWACDSGGIVAGFLVQLVGNEAGGCPFIQD